MNCKQDKAEVVLSNVSVQYLYIGFLAAARESVQDQHNGGRVVLMLCTLLARQRSPDEQKNKGYCTSTQQEERIAQTDKPSPIALTSPKRQLPYANLAGAEAETPRTTHGCELQTK